MADSPLASSTSGSSSNLLGKTQEVAKIITKRGLKFKMSLGSEVNINYQMVEGHGYNLSKKKRTRLQIMEVEFEMRRGLLLFHFHCERSSNQI